MLAELNSVVSSSLPVNNGPSVNGTDAGQEGGNTTEHYPDENIKTSSAVQHTTDIPATPQVKNGDKASSSLDGNASGPTPMTIIDIPSSSIKTNVSGPIELTDRIDIPHRTVEETIHRIDLLNVNDDSSNEIPSDLGKGIDIAMSYASPVDQSPHISMKLDKVADKQDVDTNARAKMIIPRDTSGRSTIDKRKREQLELLSPENKVSKLTLEYDVEEFYNKYLRNKFLKNKILPLFVDINKFPVFYDKFYNSFKALGDIHNKAMNAYVQIFNAENSVPACGVPGFKAG